MIFRKSTHYAANRYDIISNFVLRLPLLLGVLDCIVTILFGVYLVLWLF